MKAIFAGLLRVVTAFAVLGAAGNCCALSQRTFVSVTGIDTNPCSVMAPCRTFGTAISQTSAGGEVIVLDSGGYGPVTITQPISITAPTGVYAGVSVMSGTGIVVNAGAGIVTLTGLTILGLGGTTGIDYQSGATLRLNNIVVSGFATTGTGLKSSGASSGSVAILDSAFLDNSLGDGFHASAGQLMKVSIERTRFDGNGTGIQLGSNVAGVVSDTSITNSSVAGYIQAVFSNSTKVTIERCTISGNQNGFYVGAMLSAPTTVQIVDSEFSDNSGTAIIAQTGAAYFSNTRITRNTSGIANSAGSTISFGDNLVYANGGSEVFSSTLLKK